MLENGRLWCTFSFFAWTQKEGRWEAAIPSDDTTRKGGLKWHMKHLEEKFYRAYRAGTLAMPVSASQKNWNPMGRSGTGLSSTILLRIHLLRSIWKNIMDFINWQGILLRSLMRWCTCTVLYQQYRWMKKSFMIFPPPKTGLSWSWSTQRKTAHS